MSFYTATMPFVTTIDTLQFSKRMQKAGLGKEVSDELAEALKEASSQSMEVIATKQDIKLLKKDIELLRNDMQKDMQNLEQRIINKLGSIIVIAVGILIAVIKL
jgi:hypothetical protein